MNSYCTNFCSVGFILIGTVFFVSTAFVLLGLKFKKIANVKSPIVKRIISQNIITISLFLALISPTDIFNVLFFILLFFVLKEMLSYTVTFNGISWRFNLSNYLLATIPLLAAISIYSIHYLPFAFLFSYLLFVICILFFFPFDEMCRCLIEITVTFLVMASLSSIIYLHQLPQGIEFSLTVVFLTNFSDVFALIGGNLLGKRHFVPLISPNKTVAGVVVALIATVIIAWAFNQALSLDLKWWQIIIVALIISISGQLGDLVASFAKRTVNIKDYGNAIPGHGGFIDRFDSLVFSLPITIALLIGMQII